MKIFITGGAGFIGSHIVEALAKEHEVTVFDNFSSGKLENLLSVKDRIKIVKGDILNKNLLRKSMKNHDLIIHLAAQLEIGTAIENPHRDLEVNLIGTLNVLEAMKENNIKRIIFASSAAVYGEPENLPTREEDPKRPQWAYGASKLSCEHYLSVYHELYEIRFVALRYAIIYGPREWYGRVQTIFLKRAYYNQPLVIFGDGNQTRDYLYIDDLVDAHIRIINEDKFEREIYNLGSGKETKIKDLAKIVLDITGKNLDIMYEDLREGEFSRYVEGVWKKPGELKRMCLDISKIRRDYGWKPKTDLKEGLEIEYKWFIQNPKVWDTKPKI